MENKELNSCLMLAVNLDCPISLKVMFDEPDLKDTGVELDSHITLLYAQGKEIDRSRLVYDMKEILGDEYWDLIEKIQSFANEFRRNEQHFISYLKEMGEVDFSKNNNNIDFTIDNKDNKVIQLDNINNDFLYTQEDDLKSQIKKRDKDINQLTNSVNELSKIFKDLQIIVQEQGTILDRIDYNIDTSYENSQKGQKYIKKAEEYHKNSCFRNVILLLFTIIFIETIMIIFKML